MKQIILQFSIRAIMTFMVLFPRFGHSQEGVFDFATGEQIPAALTSEKYAWCTTFFQDEKPLRMELQADFDLLFQQKDPEQYHPGIMMIFLDDREFARINVRVQPRGYSRLKACAYPPLKIDFSHSGTELKPVKQLDELKMVALCRDGALQQQFLVTEYLVYRMYAILTDLSLGVRRGQISYVNTGDGRKMYEGPAFFIEDIDKMADRFDAREYQEEDPGLERMDSIQAGIMTVFQFMIGNLDWSINRYHNVKLIEEGKKGAGTLYTIPYDFDLSRFVDAIYSAAPFEPDLAPPPVGRIYRGPCFSIDQIEVVLERFLEKEEAIFSLLTSLEPMLNAEKLEEISNSLESFYRLIKNPEQVRTYFITYCLD